MATETKVQYTPGPWTVVEFDGSAEVHDANGYRVADLDCEREDEEVQANALLIAAAPTMREALMAAEDALAVAASYRAPDQARITKALDTVRAALATT